MSQSPVRRRYLPAEDTYLLRDALKSFSGGCCLEIGFGSGAILADVSRRFDVAVGTDVIELRDAKLARGPSIDLVLSDRAACFRKGTFDLVFFNPPYLPSEEISDYAVDGGPSGIEVALSFLDDALRVLKRGGTVVGLLSTEGDVRSFLTHCESIGLSVESITTKRMFHETLAVFSIRRREDAAHPQG